MIIRRVYFLIFFLLLSFTTIIHSQTHNWSMLNYDRARSLWVQDETVLYPPLQKSSEYNIMTPGTVSISGMTLHNGLLCVSTADNEINTVEAIDIASGDTLWTFQIPESRGGMGFICAQTDSLVFAGGQYGLGLYALDRQTGDIKWQQPIGNLYTRNAMIDGEFLYILSDSLFCFNISDGSKVWSSFAQKYIQAVR